MMPEESKVQWVYSSRNNLELEERYNHWASEYEADLNKDYDYTGPPRAGELLACHVPKDARILDAGAGTGLVGQILAGLGYGDLTAMDLSQGMLEESRKKNVYRELRRMVMGEPLDFPTAAFDAVISVGVLTVGHAPANSLDELVRVTKRGGHIVFTLRPDVYEAGGFKEKHAALEAAGKWHHVETTEQFQALSKGEPDVYHQVWVYRVT
jgi:SAM-dependent methyltransferase